MHLEIEIPDKYADKLETVEEVDPTIREQIEIEVLPQALRLINDAHRQVDERNLSVGAGGPAESGDAPTEGPDAE